MHFRIFGHQNYCRALVLLIYKSPTKQLLRAKPSRMGAGSVAIFVPLIAGPFTVAAVAIGLYWLVANAYNCLVAANVHSSRSAAAGTRQVVRTCRTQHAARCATAEPGAAGTGAHRLFAPAGSHCRFRLDALSGGGSAEKL